MPILFRDVCDLLSRLEEIVHHDPAYLPAKAREKGKESVTQWIAYHKISIQTSQPELVAILSAIFPANRPDRVYNIQHQRLIGLLKRCLGLGRQRAEILEQWRIPGRGDLADCVERVLQQTDDPTTLAKQKVTIVDVDDALSAVAARSRFSDSKIRQREADAHVLLTLERIFRHLHSRDAKWLTRMILKDFVCIEDVLQGANMLYAAIDPRFPSAMRMYSHFEDAVKELQRSAVSNLTPKLSARKPLVPLLNSKVGPPGFVKAKGGIKHVLSLAQGRLFSVERKYDGEYCQIHIDLSHEIPRIQIFSKSGKDSTNDRIGLHRAIQLGLRIGQTGCKFSKHCIVEGELLVWSELDKKVLDFCKIRKHVNRSGSYIGISKDSQ